MGFCLAASVVAANESHTAQVWQIDPKVAASLTPEAAFGSYLIRVPVGFTEAENDSYKDADHYEWRGVTRADATRPVINIYISQLTPEQAQSNPIQHGIDLLEKGGRSNVIRYLRTPGETGMVNGVWVSRFYDRCHFNGTKIETDLHAVNYIWIDGGRLIMASGFDAERYWKDTQPQLEASIMSVHGVPDGQTSLHVAVPGA